MSRKITLIGAGSVVFAKTLIGDILQYQGLSAARICLMDIDPDRLKVAETMMRRVAAKLGVPARIEATMDQRKAITGAKYVICTVQVGGFKPSTVADFEIPAKYGLRQTIGDTLGIGGIFRGLRTIPVILNIASDIADVAHPDCLFLNYTNPMAMNCWAVDEGAGIPHVGLCHSVFGTARQLASHLNLPMRDISYLVAGINHMAFFLKLHYRGQDAYPLLFEKLDDPERNYEKVRYEMMRRLGYFVTESSEHQAEYIPHFIHFGEEMVEQFDIPINEYIRRCEGILSTWEKTEAELIGDSGDIEVAPQSQEYGSHIIHSLETNIPRTVYGNVPNNGIIDNLEPGCCVEVPCIVDGNGLQPTKIGKLPPQLAAICSTNINVQRLTVTAALTGKREHIYHAAMLDPHTAATLPFDKIWAMCDEMIERHQKDGYLGEFAPTISNTGRTHRGLGDRIIAKARAIDPPLDQVGGEFEVEITVANPRGETAYVELEVVPENAAISLESSTVKLEAAPGEETKTVVRGRLDAVVADETFIHLKTDAPDILAVSASLIPRRVIETGNDGFAHFAMDLSGFPCAEGKVRRTSRFVEIEIEVKDSKPEVSPGSPWTASCVELFFSAEDKNAITQLFVLPGEGDVVGVFDPGGKQVEGVDFKFAKTKLDYWFRAEIPLARIGVPQEGPFLMDVIMGLGALGDAHSGGRTSLGGGFKAHVNNDVAWLVRA